MQEVSTLLRTIREQSGKSLRIRGPARLKGRARVQGSKNTANKLVAAAVALPGKYEIRDFPLVLDPLELLAAVEMLGGEVAMEGNTVRLDTRSVRNKPLPYALTKSTTGVFGLAGALLGRFGSVHIGKPGGDDIGPRPVGFHLDGFRALGAEIRDLSDHVEGQLAETPRDKQFTLPMPSTGAAVNFILAAVASGGTARLENAPNDGDMQAMYRFIQAAGVSLKASGRNIHIDARGARNEDKLVTFRCSPDRNDACTWLCYGALSSEGLLIENVPAKDLEPALDVLRTRNVQISKKDESTLLVKSPERSAVIPPDTVVVAGTAPRFHSDWAPLLEVVLTQLSGTCRVVETLFAHRMRQAELLEKMGANVHIEGGPPPAGVTLHFPKDTKDARYIVDIKGPTALAPITTDVGYDVRACAAMVMAASQAHGVSVLSGLRALYRGYENIVERLSQIGMDIATDSPRTP